MAAQNLNNFIANIKANSIPLETEADILSAIATVQEGLNNLAAPDRVKKELLSYLNNDTVPNDPEHPELRIERLRTAFKKSIESVSLGVYLAEAASSNPPEQEVRQFSPEKLIASFDSLQDRSDKKVELAISRYAESMTRGEWAALLGKNWTAKNLEQYLAQRLAAETRHSPALFENKQKVAEVVRSAIKERAQVEREYEEIYEHLSTTPDPLTIINNDHDVKDAYFSVEIAEEENFRVRSSRNVVEQNAISERIDDPSYVEASVLLAQHHPTFIETPKKLHEEALRVASSVNQLMEPEPITAAAIESNSRVAQEMSEALLLRVAALKGLEPQSVAPKIKALSTTERFEEIQKFFISDFYALLENNKNKDLITIFGEKVVSSDAFLAVQEYIKSNQYTGGGSSAVSGLFGYVAKPVIGDVQEPVNAMAGMAFLFKMKGSDGKTPAMIENFAKANNLPIPKTEMELFLLMGEVAKDLQKRQTRTAFSSEKFSSLSGNEQRYLQKFQFKDGLLIRSDMLPASFRELLARLYTAEYNAISVTTGFPKLDFSAIGSLGEQGKSLVGGAAKLANLGLAFSGPAGAVLATILSVFGGGGEQPGGLSANRRKQSGGFPFLLVIPLILIILFVFVMIPGGWQDSKDAENAIRATAGGITEGGSNLDCTVEPNKSSNPDCKLTQCTGNCEWPVQPACIIEGPFVGSHASNHLSAVDFIAPGKNQFDLYDAPVISPVDGVVQVADFNYGDNTGHIGFGAGTFNSYGNVVMIKPDAGQGTLLFAHLRQKQVVTVGQHITGKSTVVGYVDSTGYSGGEAGTHLHFEVVGGDVNSVLPFPVPPCIGLADCSKKMGRSACF